jgi:hypothetical protein
MSKGTVKWFNPTKGYGSFNRRVAAAEMCLSTSLRSKEPASAVSMRGRSSNTRKSRTGAKLRLRTSRFSRLQPISAEPSTPVQRFSAAKFGYFAMSGQGADARLAAAREPGPIESA